MDRETLRALQAPVRDRYKADPASAVTPVDADGVLDDDGMTVTVSTWAGPVRAGLHVATGGDGTDACSADMLLQALVGCLGVTLRAVATSMQLDLGHVELHASSSFDARGTLGIDRGAEVGVAPITVVATVDAALDATTRERLQASTERYCVVGRSLRTPPSLVVRRRDG